MKSTAFKKFRTAIPIIIFSLFSIGIIKFPYASITGARQGLSFCVQTVIPCLFPFTVVGIFLNKSGGILYLNKVFNKVSQPILKINGTEFSIFLLSLVGGYPMGAKIIGEMQREGKITKKRAYFLLTFCINASPTFFISAVGIGIFSSKYVGVILFFANLLSSVTYILLLGRITFKDESVKYKKDIFYTFGDSLVLSVKESAEIFLGICGFVTIFSTLNSLLNEIIEADWLKLVLGVLFEVTTACDLASKENIHIYFYSFIITFGGLSTIFQILTCLNDCNISFVYLFLSRLIGGILSSLYCFIFFKIFPAALPTFSTHNNIILNRTTPLIPTLSLIVLGILYLIYINRCFLGKNT